MKYVALFMLCIIFLTAAACSNKTEPTPANHSAKDSLYPSNNNSNEQTIQLNEMEKQGILLGQHEINKDLYLVSIDIQMSEEEKQALLEKSIDEIIAEYKQLYFLNLSQIPEKSKENLKPGSLVIYTLMNNIQMDTRPPTIKIADIRIAET